MSVLRDAVEKALNEIEQRLKSIPDTAERQKRTLSAAETNEITKLLDDRDSLWHQREDLVKQEKRSNEAAAAIDGAAPGAVGSRWSW